MEEMNKLTLEVGFLAQREQAKRNIDQACAIAATVDKEDTVLTSEYIDALENVYNGAVANKWGADTKLLACLVLGSNNLIGENLILRARLKEAVSTIVSQALTAGRISLCGR
jgi:hypothetical protein